MAKITALTAETSLASGDLFVIVDVGDTTQSANGSTNKMTASNVAVGLAGLAGAKVEIGIACSDETTAIDSTGEKASFRMPFAMTVTEVRANLVSACGSGTFTVDIEEGGTTILSTPLTIDAGELTSESATPSVVSDTALADDAEITIDVDDDGDSTATGLKVWIIGTRA